MEAHAQELEHAVQKLMRRFGRQCKGMGNVLVTLVRQTEAQWLALGEQVLPLAQAAQQRLRGATALSEAHHRIAHQSRRLT